MGQAEEPFLSRWKRVGLFFTALWVVAIFAYAAWHHVYELKFYPLTFLETCMQYALNTSRCDALLTRVQEEWKRIPFDWARPAILAFGPLPLFWGLAWSAAAIACRASARNRRSPQRGTFDSSSRSHETNPRRT
jgi:hypothetical protein